MEKNTGYYFIWTSKCQRSCIIDENTKAGFRALKSITDFGNEKSGWEESMFTRLYKALVLPIMDYESSVVITAAEYAE